MYINVEFWLRKKIIEGKKVRLTTIKAGDKNQT